MKSTLYKKSTLAIIALAFSLISFEASSAEIYKCTVNGKPVFTDKPCANGESVTLSKSNSLTREVYSSDEWYEGSSGFEEASELAEIYKAPMIIYFRTDWCPYCVAVEKNILTKTDAQNAIQKFVKVKINPEHGAAEMKLFKGMQASGFPTFLVKTRADEISRVSVTPGENAKNKGVKNISVKEFVANMSKF